MDASLITPLARGFSFPYIHMHLHDLESASRNGIQGIFDWGALIAYSASLLLCIA